MRPEVSGAIYHLLHQRLHSIIGLNSKFIIFSFCKIQKTFRFAILSFFEFGDHL